MVNVAVFLLEPGPEFLLATVAITVIFAVVAQFVVKLPAPDGGIVAETPAEFRDDLVPQGTFHWPFRPDQLLVRAMNALLIAP